MRERETRPPPRPLRNPVSYHRIFAVEPLGVVALAVEAVEVVVAGEVAAVVASPVVRPHRCPVPYLRGAVALRNLLSTHRPQCLRSRRGKSPRGGNLRRVDQRTHHSGRLRCRARSSSGLDPSPATRASPDSRSDHRAPVPFPLAPAKSGSHGKIHVSCCHGLIASRCRIRQIVYDSSADRCDPGRGGPDPRGIVGSGVHRTRPHSGRRGP